MNAVVDEDGNIELPNLSNPLAEGLTPAKLKEAIAKAYRDEKLLNRAEVTVKFREAEEEPRDEKAPAEKTP